MRFAPEWPIRAMRDFFTPGCVLRAELTLSASYGISHAGWRTHTVLDCAFRAELRASRNFELHFWGFMQALRQTDAARNSS